MSLSVWEEKEKRIGIVLSALEGEIRRFSSAPIPRTFLGAARAGRLTTVASGKENLRERVIFQVGRYGRLRRIYAVARASPLPLETLESGQGRSYRVASRKRPGVVESKSAVLTDKTNWVTLGRV